MDLYNRYLMRSSGEAKHQAQTPAEAATFAALDFLTSKGLLDSSFGSKDETYKNRTMEEMKEAIEIALGRFN